MYEFDHVGIVVANMDQALGFYQMLGFKVVRETKIVAANLRLVYLEQGGLTLELLSDGSGKPGGLKHFALRTTQIDKLYAHLRQAGVTLLQQEVQVHDRLKYFFAQGPSGEWLEFVEQEEEAL